MSDALTPDALGEEAAVATTTPAVPAAVESESAGGVNTVPAERFNGLMSTYQREKSQWENDLASMKTELESLRDNKENSSVSETNDLQEQVSQLTDLVGRLVQTNVKSERDQVLDRYPEAKPFADLILGESAEEIEQVASAIAERVKLLNPVATPEVAAGEEAAPTGVEAPAGDATPEAPAAPVAPEVAGSAGVTGAVAVQTKKQAALDAGDFSGFLEAQFELQQMQDPGQLA